LCLLSWIKKPKVHFQLLSAGTGRGPIEGRDRCAVGGFSFYLEKTPGMGREGNGEPSRRNRDPERKKDPSVYPSSRYRNICQNRKGAQSHHYVPAPAWHGLTLLHRSRDTERSSTNSSGGISQGV